MVTAMLINYSSYGYSVCYSVAHNYIRHTSKYPNLMQTIELSLYDYSWAILHSGATFLAGITLGSGGLLEQEQAWRAF